MNDFVLPRLTILISNKLLGQESVLSPYIWKLAIDHLHIFSPTLMRHLVPCHASGVLPNLQLCVASQGSLRLLILILASLRGLLLRKKNPSFLTVFSIAGFLHYKRTAVKRKLHSKIISSDMIEFFRRIRWWRSEVKIRTGRLSNRRRKNWHVPAFVTSWCHLAIMARSRDWIKIHVFVISRNQPASSDDMMLKRRWLRSSSRSSSWRSPVTMLQTLTRCHRKFS